MRFSFQAAQPVAFCHGGSRKQMWLLRPLRLRSENPTRIRRGRFSRTVAGAHSPPCHADVPSPSVVTTEPATDPAAPRPQTAGGVRLRARHVLQTGQASSRASTLAGGSSRPSRRTGAAGRADEGDIPCSGHGRAAPPGIGRPGTCCFDLFVLWAGDVAYSQRETRGSGKVPELGCDGEWPAA